VAYLLNCTTLKTTLIFNYQNLGGGRKSQEEEEEADVSL